MMASVPSAWRHHIRPQDFIWVLLFAALAAFSPERNWIFITVLMALGLVQVLEARIGALPSIVLKLALCYMLIYLSGGLQSPFYIFLLLPVMSASTSLGFIGAAIVTVLASAEYLSFWLLLEPNYYVDPEGRLQLALRILSFPLVGYLTHQLAEAKRLEANKYQAAAEQLAAANQSLKEAEAQVRRSDRLAALGQLTAGLAHERRAGELDRPRDGWFYQRRSRSRQFTDHALSGFRPAPALAAGDRGSLRAARQSDQTVRAGTKRSVVRHHGL
jgi:signal transduction histidine kinase